MANSSDSVASDSTSSPPDEGLPEWEPLTPELVEDEAIRGDFVIQWAVVGLALLFGFSQIADTRTLVHIRTGEYLATHGILPPARDVFSYTASDRSWINLSWLFDLIVSGVHSLGGGLALSILQGVLAGGTFLLLSHTHRPGIRTWWGSISAVLALLVCFPQFTMQPELVTLLGMTFVLWIALAGDEKSRTGRLIVLVPVIWFWAQLDQRAFLGWLLLGSFALGETLRARTPTRDITGSAGEPLSNGEASSRAKAWWRVTGLAVAVSVLHPFLWRVWMSPISLYGVDYPALRQMFPRPQRAEIGFHSIGHSAFWESLNHGTVAAMLLLAVTLVALFLNRRRLHPGHVIAVIVFNLLGCLATHELTVASLINCAICTVNAQTWYRERFGQVYSTDWRELLFSRGGRAVTVVAFFALAWLVVSGRIDGPGGKRTGVGFDDGLLAQMQSYQAVSTDALDGRPFHFAPRQGDLLIWSGQRSFVDTRAGLFAGKGERDLIALHHKTRSAMRQQREGVSGLGDRKTWQATFDNYGVTHVMPRLSIPAPDYLTFGDLLSSPDWTLTKLSGATAVLYRTDLEEKFARDYVDSHQVNFVEQAFRTKKPADADTATLTGREWPKSASTYDSLFSLRRPSFSADDLSAMHCSVLAESLRDIPLTDRAALCVLAIRHATAALTNNVNSADAFRSLGQAHKTLHEIEAVVQNSSKQPWPHSLHATQAIAAFQQAAQLQTEDYASRGALIDLYRQSSKADLTLEMIHQMKRLLPTGTAANEEQTKIREQLVEMEYSIDEGISRLVTQCETRLKDGTDRLQVASMAYQAGGVLAAIRILEEDAPYREGNMSAKLALGLWLIEAGRIREGHETLEAVEQIARGKNVSGWRDAVALSALTNGSYARAINLWREQYRELEENRSSSLLNTMPFVTLNQYWYSPDQYPSTHAASAFQNMVEIQPEMSQLAYHMAMARIESGDPTEAVELLKSTIKADPASPLRPLITFYLFCLTGEKIPAAPPEQVTPEEIESLEAATPTKAQ